MTSPKLYNHQLKHVEKIESILSRYSIAADGSEPGSGKTHTTSLIAHKYNKKIVVIGPNSSRHTWEDAITKYNLTTGIFGFMTYESFRSSGKNQPKHGLLIKNEQEYEASEKLDKLSKEDYLIIFDEAQCLKNYSITFKAARAFISCMLKGKSWVMFLSGSLLDKDTQVYNYMNLFGIISQRYLYTNRFGRIDLSVKEELDNWILNTKLANEYIKYLVASPFKATPKDSKRFVYDVFIKFIRPELMSTMPKYFEKDENENLVATLNIRNGFYKLNKRDMILYDELLNKLSDSINFDGQNANIQAGGMLNISRMLTYIQKCKSFDMARIAKRDLTDDVNCKVILFVNYNEVIDSLSEYLKEYDPIILRGCVKVEERIRLTNIFNEENCNRRLIIANTSVGSRSLNLQDTSEGGRFKRRHYIMGSYHINEIHQAAHRTYRIGTVGEAYVRFFYGITDRGITEVKILNALAKGGMVMSDFSGDKEVIFPNDYEADYEMEDINSSVDELDECFKEFCV